MTAMSLNAGVRLFVKSRANQENLAIASTIASLREVIDEIRRRRLDTVLEYFPLCEVTLVLGREDNGHLKLGEFKRIRYLGLMELLGNSHIPSYVFSLSYDHYVSVDAVARIVHLECKWCPTFQ